MPKKVKCSFFAGQKNALHQMDVKQFTPLRNIFNVNSRERYFLKKKKTKTQPKLSLVYEVRMKKNIKNEHQTVRYSS